MKITLESQPCHNFSIMNTLLIPRDPRDGREKFVLSNYAAGGTGCIVIVDTETLEGETYEFPRDAGAWALLWLEDRGELLIGTCDILGYLHCFDMEKREFIYSERLETETYFWNFVLGGDGCIYGGTYPGCVLARFDPETRTLSDLGRVGTEARNQYSRPAFRNADGNVLISAGYYRSQAWLYEVNSGKYRRLGKDGDRVHGVGEDIICLENEGSLKFLDACTLTLIGDPVRQEEARRYQEAGLWGRESIPQYLRDLDPVPLPGLPQGTTGLKTASGAVIGTCGQEIFVVREGRTAFRRIPGRAPATAIMTIVSWEGGTIWGSGENGQTMFHYDPRTGKYENTNSVANAGGEVYGVVPFEGKLYLSSYIGGDHIVYDPAQPWDQRGNVNPRCLASVAPQMVRPHAKSVLGPDGGVWTGWWASYGNYGGGVTRLDPATNEVNSWFDLIPGQAVEHIAAGREALFLVTSGEASGMAAKREGFHLVKLDTSGQILNKIQFEPGVTFSRITVHRGRVYAASADSGKDECVLLIFKEDDLEFLGSKRLGAARDRITDMLLWNDRLLVFQRSLRALLLSLPGCDVLEECGLPNWVGTTTVDQSGDVLFASQNSLYRLKMN